MEPSVREEACFEAGIKFGTLYHQFAGTPLTPESAGSLETAMAEAVENQPGCVAADVEIHRDRVREAIAEGAADYLELTGRFMTVEMTIHHEGEAVVARMAMVDGYPLMEVADVGSVGDGGGANGAS